MKDLTDDRLRALYGALAADAPDTPHPDADHLADAALGRGTPESRLATYDHALTCAACRSELALLETTATAARSLRRQQLQVRFVLAAAAAIVVAVGLSTVTRGSLDRVRRLPATDVDRGTDQTANGQNARATAIELVAPVGTVAAGTRPSLQWRSIPGATSYMVEIVRDSGLVVLRTETRDTSLAWPSLPPGQTYRWRVSARAPNGSVRRSAFTDLRVLSR